MYSKTCVFFIILATIWKNAHSIVDCNKQNFLCNSTTTFYDCIDDGINNTVTDPTDPSFTLNTCSSGTICDKNRLFPCASFTLLPTTVEVTTIKTTFKPTTKTTIKTTIKQSTNNANHANTNDDIVTEPTTNTTVKPVVTGWNFNCKITGRFLSTRRIDCKEYVICSLNSSGNLIATYYQCPATTIFNPSLLKCTLASLATCTPITTTTPRVTLHPPICKGNGRCRNPFIADCKGYVVSTTDSKRKHIEAYYLCPATSIFNPSTLKCTIPPFYICPSKVTTVKPTTRRVTIKPTTRRVTVKITTTTKCSTRCTAVGKKSDPSLANCKGYIMCSRDVSGNFVEAKFICPLSSVFDPVNNICSIFYRCTPPCTKAGRFADPSVTGCKGFTLCSQILFVFIQTKYTCASITVFSPVTKLCTLPSVYICPN